MATTFGNLRPQGPILPFATGWQAQGLVGWWPIYSMMLKDFVGGNDLKPEGSPSYTVAHASDFGICMESSVTANRAVIDTAAGLGTLTESFTMALWATHKASPGNGQIFCMGTGSAGHNIFLTGSTGLFEWDRGSDGATVVASTTGYTDFELRHVVVTYDGTTARIYHNGKQEGSAASPTIDSGNITRIGLLVNSNSGFPEGPNAAGLWICDLRLYKRALSAEEVFLLYNKSTRWDMYRILNKKTQYFVQAPAPSATVLQPWRLQGGMGGLIAQ